MNGNMSVDDILSEIESRQKGVKPVGEAQSMSQIDEMINEILTERAHAKIEEEKRILSEKEKENLEREIKSQTKTLTREIFKIKKEEEKQERRIFGTAPVDEPPAANPKEAPVTPDSEELLHFDSQKSEADFEGHEIVKKDDRDHIRIEKEDMTNHFGRFNEEKEEDKPKEKKPSINLDTYKKLKKRRNEKISEFVLESKSETIEQDAVKDETPIPEAEAEAPKTEEEASEPNVADEVLEQALEEKKAPDFDEILYDDFSKKEVIENELQKKTKLQKISLIISGIASIFSLFFVFAKSADGEISSLGLSFSPTFFAAANLALLLIALGGSFGVITNTIKSFVDGKDRKDVLFLTIAVVGLAVNAAFCFKPEKLLLPNVHLYTPVIVLIIFVNEVSKYLELSRIARNFRFASGTANKFAVSYVGDVKTAADMTKGLIDEEPMLAKNQNVQFYRNFVPSEFAPSITDKVCKLTSFVVVPLGLLVSIGIFLLTKEPYTVFTALSAVIALGGGFIGAITSAFPLFDTSDLINRFSGMVPSYEEINKFSETNSCLIDAEELFTEQSVILHGIKTFGEGRIDNAILDAASVACSANSILKYIFFDVIERRTELLKPVDSIIYEDLMGLSSWVDEKRVLIGNRELMINHSVAVPNKEYDEKYRQKGLDVVYLATGGELCAVFIVEFKAEKRSTDIMRLLVKNNIKPVVKTVDSAVTTDLISRVYGIELDQVKVIPSRLHRTFEEETESVEKTESMLGNNGTLYGFSVMLIAAKKLSFCIKFGTILHVASVVLGVMCLLALYVLQLGAFMGSAQMFVFMLVFALIYCVYEKNIRI